MTRRRHSSLLLLFLAALFALAFLRLVFGELLAERVESFLSVIRIRAELVRHLNVANMRGALEDLGELDQT